MASLLELIKRAAVDAVAASHPAEVVFGKVEAAVPLTVRINQWLTLTEDFLVLGENARVKRDSLCKEDTLILLQQQGGQSFLVLDVLPGADWSLPEAGAVTWAEITGKPEAFPPHAHNHAWGDVLDKPDAYPPAEHTHAASQISGLLSLIYPVGSIYMSAASTNPATYFGGTWVAWGSGRVPVSVEAANTSFNSADKTGGVAAISLAHSHTVNSHTHTGPSHTHTVSGHTHTTASHALSASQIPAHTHSASSNSAGAHAHTASSNSTGAHAHNIPVWLNASGTGKCYPEGWSNKPTDGTSATASAGGHSHTISIGSGGAHAHTISVGSTGGGAGHAHGNTGSTSLTTTAAGTGNTGAAAPGTNQRLSSAQSILPPYITCYMWKRTE